MNAATRFEAIKAISELYIVAVGFRGNSSGQVYGMAMDAVTLDQHLGLVRGLESAGIVERKGDWLQLSPLGADLCSVICGRIRNEAGSIADAALVSQATQESREVGQ